MLVFIHPRLRRSDSRTVHNLIPTGPLEYDPFCDNRPKIIVLETQRTHIAGRPGRRGNLPQNLTGGAIICAGHTVGHCLALLTALER